MADFQNDMAFQFARKLNRQPFYESFKNVSIIFIVMSFGVYFFIKKERYSLIFTASALSLFILFVNIRFLSQQPFVMKTNFIDFFILL